MDSETNLSQGEISSQADDALALTGAVPGLWLRRSRMFVDSAAIRGLRSGGAQCTGMSRCNPFRSAGAKILMD